MKPIIKTILYLTLFSIAMGFLETAVVIYLRELYYPNGFYFPMVTTSKLVLKTELLRELATLIMLCSIGIIAGKNLIQRFVFFLYCFAIWDLFYYVFLKFLLNWPESLLTWDILFLLPMPWYGPVLAPCIISLTMIGFTSIIVYYQLKKIDLVFTKIDWLILLCSSLIFILSFTLEFILWYMSIENINFSMGFDFIPQHYNWYLFAMAEGMLLLDLFSIYRRNHII